MTRKVNKRYHPALNSSPRKWTESEVSEAWKYVLRNSNAKFTRRTWSKLTRGVAQIAPEHSQPPVTQPERDLHQNLHPVTSPEPVTTTEPVTIPHKGILKNSHFHSDSDSHFSPCSPGAVRFSPIVTTIPYDTETSDYDSEMDWEDEGPLFDDL
ncbi:hypothetical protein CJU90_3026 [Yarrowia sp. C11]|nr:hypothetical protein CKK34_4476 [Yarrowia sp. E02]KAG5369563.1 hypothetical protein CJU90_3026 [Yarrowia sp. C11]